MSNLLQEILNEFACSVLNHTNNKIYVWHFYSEERYVDFLKGSKCWGGQGLFGTDEVLEFNKLKDNTLVIIQHDGIETARYKYVPIIKGTIEYKEISGEKKTNRTLSFTIRKGINDNEINYIDTDEKSLDFNSVEDVKIYIKNKYGSCKLTERNV